MEADPGKETNKGNPTAPPSRQPLPSPPPPPPLPPPPPKLQQQQPQPPATTPAPAPPTSERPLPQQPSLPRIISLGTAHAGPVAPNRPDNSPAMPPWSVSPPGLPLALRPLSLTPLANRDGSPRAAPLPLARYVSPDEMDLIVESGADLTAFPGPGLCLLERAIEPASRPGSGGGSEPGPGAGAGAAVGEAEQGFCATAVTAAGSAAMAVPLSPLLSNPQNADQTPARGRPALRSTQSLHGIPEGPSTAALKGGEGAVGGTMGHQDCAPPGSDNYQPLPTRVYGAAGSGAVQQLGFGQLPPVVVPDSEPWVSEQPDDCPPAYGLTSLPLPPASALQEQPSGRYRLLQQQQSRQPARESGPTKALAAGLASVMEDEGVGSGVGGSSGEFTPMGLGDFSTVVLPSPVEVTVAVRVGSGTGRRGRGGGGRQDEDSRSGYMRGPVCGTFDAQRYMAGRDCIHNGNRWMSRSHFEKVGGSKMAKWYRSIRVLPDLEPLGEWLERHGMPVQKGPSRRSRKRTADSGDEQGSGQGPEAPDGGADRAGSPDDDAAAATSPAAASPTPPAATTAAGPVDGTGATGAAAAASAANSPGEGAPADPLFPPERPALPPVPRLPTGDDKFLKRLLNTLSPSQSQPLELQRESSSQLPTQPKQSLLLQHPSLDLLEGAADRAAHTAAATPAAAAANISSDYYGPGDRPIRLRSMPMPAGSGTTLLGPADSYPADSRGGHGGAQGSQGHKAPPQASDLAPLRWRMIRNARSLDMGDVPSQQLSPRAPTLHLGLQWPEPPPSQHPTRPDHAQQRSRQEQAGSRLGPFATGGYAAAAMASAAEAEAPEDDAMEMEMGLPPRMGSFEGRNYAAPRLQVLACMEPPPPRPRRRVPSPTGEEDGDRHSPHGADERAWREEEQLQDELDAIHHLRSNGPGVYRQGSVAAAAAAAVAAGDSYTLRESGVPRRPQGVYYAEEPTARLVYCRPRPAHANTGASGNPSRLAFLEPRGTLGGGGGGVGGGGESNYDRCRAESDYAAAAAAAASDPDADYPDAYQRPIQRRRLALATLDGYDFDTPAGDSHHYRHQQQHQQQQQQYHQRQHQQQQHRMMEMEYDEYQPREARQCAARSRTFAAPSGVMMADEEWEAAARTHPGSGGGGGGSGAARSPSGARLRPGLQPYRSSPPILYTPGGMVAGRESSGRGLQGPPVQGSGFKRNAAWLQDAREDRSQ